MIAVDTNILVRLLTGDDPRQASRAARVMERSDILIPKTVLLETEWVLRHAYDIDKSAVIKGFQALLGLPNVNVEDQQTVYQAIAWSESGLDFADALHLAASAQAIRFVTFDKAFVKSARKHTSVDVVLP